ncbi:MAG TPA: hypothetical protein VFN51_01130 [Candidatus Saccharimonadales bacterium]|nr:hypothetical protein [Candidatus Saccharimonadales bacterium]
MNTNKPKQPRKHHEGASSLNYMDAVFLRKGRREIGRKRAGRTAVENGVEIGKRSTRRSLLAAGLVVGSLVGVGEGLATYNNDSPYGKNMTRFYKSAYPNHNASGTPAEKAKLTDDPYTFTVPLVTKSPSSTDHNYPDKHMGKVTDSIASTTHPSTVPETSFTPASEYQDNPDPLPHQKR